MTTRPDRDGGTRSGRRRACAVLAAAFAGLGVTLAAGGFVAAPILTPLVVPGAEGIVGMLTGAGAGLLARRWPGSAPDGAGRAVTDAVG